MTQFEDTFPELARRLRSDEAKETDLPGNVRFRVSKGDNISFRDIKAWRNQLDRLGVPASPEEPDDADILAEAAFELKEECEERGFESAGRAIDEFVERKQEEAAEARERNERQDLLPDFSDWRSLFKSLPQ